MAQISSAGLRCQPIISASFAALALSLVLNEQAAAQFAAAPTLQSSGTSVIDGETGGAISANTKLFIVDDFADIAWTPRPGGDFLPQSNDVTFWDGNLYGDFTVLNRINSELPAAFSGSVRSFVGTGRGGTVWFYSPGGIVVNQGAFFDVGNLLLSTGAISREADGAVRIVDAEDSRASVENDGLLRSLGYTALVAPRIRQRGLIRAGGTAAMVMAEDVTLRISDNLFDIEITVGAASDSEDNVLLVHSGETLTNATHGPGPHRVYIAAAAKDDPVTLLLGGAVQATDAVLTENGIVLSAGGDIVGGQPVASTASAGAVDLVIDEAPDSQESPPFGNVYPHLTDASISAYATGSITANAGSAIYADGDIDLVTAAGVRLDRVDAGGTLRVAAQEDAEFIGIAAGDTVEVTSSDIAIGANGRVGDGDTQSIIAQATGSITANAGSAIQADGNIDLVAGASVRLDRIDAGGAIQVTAQQGAEFTGIASANTIEVASSDIAIGPNGRIGGGNTQSITLMPDNPQVVIGSSSGGSSTVYRLDANEAGRLQAQQLTIEDAAADAPPGGSDITIGTVTLQGTRAGGGIGILRIATPGSLLVEGKLQLANAVPTSRIELVAGRRLDVLTPSGAIALLSPAGQLEGALLLDARNILVANSAIRDLSRAQPLFANRERLLGAIGNPLLPNGFVSAGQVSFRVAETLHVQNSGTLVAFGGVSARAFDIQADGASPAEVILYGRRIDPVQGVISDFRLRESVTITGSLQETSTINGCRITAVVCIQEAIILPARDTIDTVLGIEGILVQLPDSTAPQLIDASAFDASSPVVIDEPVTGTGNTQDWRVRTECVEEDRRKCP